MGQIETVASNWWSAPKSMSTPAQIVWHSHSKTGPGGQL